MTALVSFCSVEPMWPLRSETELREDILVLIKFWQAVLSDKKYIKCFVVAGGQLMRGHSTSSFGTSGAATFGQVSVGPSDDDASLTTQMILTMINNGSGTEGLIRSVISK